MLEIYILIEDNIFYSKIDTDEGQDLKTICWRDVEDIFAND